MKKLATMTLMVITLLSLPCHAGIRQFVRINQVGMYPKQEKIAVIENGRMSQPFIIKDTKGKVVFTGKVKKITTSPWSGKKRGIADFTALQEEGEYMFISDNDSCRFFIDTHALDSIAQSTLNAYYYQRSGTDIEKQHAGIWSRQKAHPDTSVIVHPSAASKNRPAGTRFSSPYGWYDAGDYNKYIVNSAFTIGQILTVYKMNRDFFARQKLHIPENANTSPDILDEMMFNLIWMLTMQDPDDGGVYHKLTTPLFEGMKMPADCRQQRYVVQKSVTATLGFAAVMALASTIYQDNVDYPLFSSQAIKASEKAWQWALSHPQAFYQQEAMNQKYKPEIKTGEYGDKDAQDEFYWAATQLYLATHDKQYLAAAERYAPATFTSPSWANPSGLATYEWATSKENNKLASTAQRQITDYSRKKSDNVATSSFQTPCGDERGDFGWASMAEHFATPGITFLFAYHLTQDSQYLKLARQNADYILGRNAMGYCFVTGFGSKSPLSPHHRISIADGVEQPVPGLLVGGPNPEQQDLSDLGTVYPSCLPDESYIDHPLSYASNEIAINWNSAAVGLFSWLAAIGDRP